MEKMELDKQQCPGLRSLFFEKRSIRPDIQLSELSA